MQVVVICEYPQERKGFRDSGLPVVGAMLGNQH